MARPLTPAPALQGPLSRDYWKYIYYNISYVQDQNMSFEIFFLKFAKSFIKKHTKKRVLKIILQNPTANIYELSL